MSGRPYFYENYDFKSGQYVGNPVSSAPGSWKPEIDMGLKYCVFSVGPSKGPDTNAFYGDGRGYFYYPARSKFPSKIRPYDPTNGTSSDGGIGYYGSGLGFPEYRFEE